MLVAHKRFINQFTIQRRILLLLANRCHASNKSIFQVLMPEVLRMIIQFCGVPNNYGIELIKASGWASFVETPNARISRPPSLWWIGTFMDMDSMVTPDAPDAPASNLSWQEVECYRHNYNNHEKFILNRQYWRFLICECQFWVNCSRWYKRKEARNCFHQLLVYEARMPYHTIYAQLHQIFGANNLKRFFFVRQISTTCTQIFICCQESVLRALKDDVVFEAFNSVTNDNRIIWLKDHKPGFSIML